MVFFFSYFEVEITLKKHINFASSVIHFMLKTQEADLVFSVQNVTIPLLIKEQALSNSRDFLKDCLVS